MSETFFHYLKKILPPELKKNLYFTYNFLDFKFKNIKVNKEFINLSKYQKQIKPLKKIKIFIWEPGGYPHFLSIFSLIAWALKLRGHPVKLLLCKGSKIACTKRSLPFKENLKDWKKSCKRCQIQCSECAKILSLEYGFIDNYIEEKRLNELFKVSNGIKFEDIYDFYFKGYYIGKNVYSSFRRYLKGRPVLKEHENVLRYYLFAGMANIEMAENFIAKERPDRVIMSQGAYTDYGLPIKVFLKKQIPVSIGLYAPWGISAGKNCQSFSFVENPRKVSPQMISEKTWQIYKNKPLSSEENGQLNNFLFSHYSSKKENKENNDFLKFKNNNPIWAVFSHLIWDASGDVYPMIYRDFNEWIVATLKEIKKIKQINWLIKVHPVEIFLPNTPERNYGVLDVIKDNLGELPPHIKFLRTNAGTNNLELYKNISGGITATGTAGLELSVLGKPALLAGDTHYAQKGFTYDALSHEQYVYYLRNIKKLKPLSGFQTERARRYAYLYFIKKQIPFDYFRKDNSDYLDYRRIENIIPGKNRYLDFVCDCIINKKDFMLP